MRRSAPVLLAAMFGVAVLPFPQHPASASCAAPYLAETERLVLARGADATVTGHAFVDGCQDVMSCSVGFGFGCQSCAYDDPPPTPLTDVGLSLVQAGRTWPLAVADAESADDDRLGRVTWTFEVPADAEPGRARLVAAGAVPVRIRLR